MSNPIVWVDIPVQDLDRAIAFYSAVLGQKVTQEGGPGFTFGLLPHDVVSVGAGGCLALEGQGLTRGTQGPLVYLDANGRLKEAVQAAVQHWGRILQPIHSIGPHGNRAIILDSEGNRIALHSLV